MSLEGKTIRKIREAVRDGRLKQPFTSRDVFEATDIPCKTARNFPSKHRVGNPSGTTEYFVQVCHRPALYRLVQTTYEPATQSR